MKILVVIIAILVSAILVRSDEDKPSSEQKIASVEVKEENKSASSAIETEKLDPEKEEGKAASGSTSKVRRSPEESEEKKAPEEIDNSKKESDEKSRSGDEDKAAAKEEEKPLEEKSASDDEALNERDSKEIDEIKSEEKGSAIVEKIVSVYNDEDGFLDILGRTADSDPSTSSRSGFGFPIHDYGSGNRLINLIPPLPSLLPPPAPPSVMPPLPLMTPMPPFLSHPPFMPSPPSFNTPKPPAYLSQPQAPPMFNHPQVPRSFYPSINDQKYSLPASRIAIGRYNKPESKDIDLLSALEKTSNAYPYHPGDNQNSSPLPRSYEMLGKVGSVANANAFKSYENNLSSNFNPYEVRRGRRTPSPYISPRHYQPYPYYKMN